MPALLVVSLVLLVVRIWAASQVGFGDSEALYASWAAHPQPAYLDHPGLIGLVARAIGEGAIPTPERTHVVTAIAATLVPWVVVAVARAAGASRNAAAGAGLVVAVVPEIAVGLFALTPDLLLAPLWLGALGLAIVGLSPSSSRSADRKSAQNEWALVGAGLLAGAAAAAKISGLLLVAALALAYVSVARSSSGTAKAEAPARAARSIWPWAGLAIGLVVLVPIVQYEVHLGFPMLRHRFVDTQGDAGLSLRNVGQLLGGQLAYLSPGLVALAAGVAVDLVRRRKDDAVSRLLFFSFAVPIVPLVVLCLWSRVAEPHWIAPPLLALPVHAARRISEGVVLFRRRALPAAVAIAAAFTAVVHFWVLVPSAGKLLPSSVDPRADIVSELYGWPIAARAIKETMLTTATPFDPEGHEVVVVGPHWTICAQLQAALPDAAVGCASAYEDDFDRWFPRDRWRQAPAVLFVTDARFPGDGAAQLPAHALVGQRRVRTFRGGRPSRVFDLYLYARHSDARR